MIHEHIDEISENVKRMEEIILNGIHRMEPSQQFWVLLIFCKALNKERYEAVCTKEYKENIANKQLKKIIEMYKGNLDICLKSRDIACKILDIDKGLYPGYKDSIKECWLKVDVEKTNKKGKKADPSLSVRSFAEHYRGYATKGVRDKPKKNRKKIKVKKINKSDLI